MNYHRNNNASRQGFLLAALTALLVGGYFILNHKPVAMKIPVPSAPIRKLIFDEEFNQNALDKAKWNTCYDNYSTDLEGCTNYGNNESEWYKASQVGVADGNLVLSAVKQPTPGYGKNAKHMTYDYASGMVATGRYMPDVPEKWSNAYGYYEARINVPSGQAAWPAFWLLPVDRKWPPEIDIMEILGQDPNKILATYFWPGSNTGSPPRDTTTHVSKTKLTDSWHVYAIDWKPGIIDWYIDGQRIKHAQSPNVSNVKMQIILNLAVGGSLPGYPDASTPASMKMLVDYVRVYKE